MKTPQCGYSSPPFIDPQPPPVETGKGSDFSSQPDGSDLWPSSPEIGKSDVNLPEKSDSLMFPAEVGGPPAKDYPPGRTDINHPPLLPSQPSTVETGVSDMQTSLLPYLDGTGGKLWECGKLID